MDKFLTFTVVGLSTSAIYAVIASGLVLTYTTTGVFNFAQGAIGMLAAFTYWQLRYDWGWSTPLALAVIRAVGAPLAAPSANRFGRIRGEDTNPGNRVRVRQNLPVSRR